MVNTAVWGCICNGLKRRASSIGVGGCCHFPGEVDLGLVDARLLAAFLHHRVFWVVGVTGGDTYQWVAWRRPLLTALLCHLLDVIIVR